jgi:hypothetical protein
MLGHPFCSSQMALKRMSGTIRFPIRVNMQYDPRDLTPVSTLGICIKQSQIGHQVHVVIASQRRIGRRDVGNIGIERWLLHRHLKLEFCTDNFEQIYHIILPQSRGVHCASLGPDKGHAAFSGSLANQASVRKQPSQSAPYPAPRIITRSAKIRDCLLSCGWIFARFLGQTSDDIG